ncbi:MAG: glycosyltransferase family 2 protein, partial [Chloroflexi bacterium]|nr:glycosyltransferase family 2 protein [Chloroflexota bacterium]
ELVVFVDDDCLPTPGLLAAHRAAHEVEGLAAIGRITWHPDLTVTPLMRVLEADTYAYTNIVVPFDASFFSYYTGNASVHRDSALAIGGFEESFPHWHEDIEFAYRLRRHGVRFVFASDAIVHHWREVQLAATLAAQRAKGRDLVRLFDAHPELRRYLPIERVADPAAHDAYFGVLLHQALLDGVAEGVAALPADDPLLARLTAEQARWTERRVAELQAEVSGLETEVARLRHVEVALATLQSEQARLEQAFVAQSTWAADLERRLRRGPAAGARAIGDVARAGLAALLAFRRGGAAPPPDRAD